jgi:hypothetical protein
VEWFENGKYVNVVKINGMDVEVKKKNGKKSERIKCVMKVKVGNIKRRG